MPRRDDPTHPRDRQIDREISQSVRLARLPLREITVPAIDRRLAPRRERTVPVCLYVSPPYPQRPLELICKEIGNEAPMHDLLA